MNLHEYQGKEVFRSAGIPVPPGKVARTVEEAVAIGKEIGYPAVVKAQKREADADKIYKDAEKAELAKNKAQAIALYEKLLTEFADTEFVSKGKKAVIEERLAVLKK